MRKQHAAAIPIMLLSALIWSATVDGADLGFALLAAGGSVAASILLAGGARPPAAAPVAAPAAEHLRPPGFATPAPARPWSPWPGRILHGLMASYLGIYFLANRPSIWLADPGAWSVMAAVLLLHLTQAVFMQRWARVAA